MGGCSEILHGVAGLAKAAAGIDRADAVLIEYRRAICRGCPEAIPCVHDANKRCRCGRCGCLLRAKTALASERCPLGKW